MKILLYEMKFLVPNYSCLQNPLLRGYSPQIPVISVLCPQLNLLNTPPPKKIPWYATATGHRIPEPQELHVVVGFIMSGCFYCHLVDVIVSLTGDSTHVRKVISFILNMGSPY